MELVSPSSKKIKKLHPEQKLIYCRKWNFLAPKKLNKTF